MVLTAHLFEVCACAAHISTGRTASEEIFEPIEMVSLPPDKAKATDDTSEQRLVLSCVRVTCKVASAKRLVVAIGELRGIWRVNCEGCAPAAAILLKLKSVQARWRR